MIQPARMTLRHRMNLCSERTPGGLSSSPFSTRTSGRCTNKPRPPSGRWRRCVLQFLCFIDCHNFALFMGSFWVVSNRLDAAAVSRSVYILYHHLQMQWTSWDRCAFDLCLLGRSIQRLTTLGPFEARGKTLYLPRPGFLCCQRWYRQWKPGETGLNAMQRFNILCVDSEQVRLMSWQLNCKIFCFVVSFFSPQQYY